MADSNLILILTMQLMTMTLCNQSPQQLRLPEQEANVLQSSQLPTVRHKVIQQQLQANIGLAKQQQVQM